MRLKLLTSALVLMLAGCGSEDAQKAAELETTTPQSSVSTEVTEPQLETETERLNAWFETQYEAELQFSPIQLSSLGRKDLYGELDDFSVAAADAALERMRTSTAEMETNFDYNKLTEEGKLSYDLWKFQLAEAEAEVPFRKNGYVFEQMGGAHTQLPTFLIGIHAVDTEKDMLDYVSRLKQSERVMDQLIEQSKANAEYGVRPPRFAFERVIEEAGKLITGAPYDDGEDAAVFADAKTKIAALVEAGTIRETRAVELERLVAKTLTENVRPAYQRLIAWLEEDMPNAMTVATGVGGQPNGEAYYARRLKQYTTTDLTPDEVHKLGLSEVARIRAEMEAIKEAVGFEGDLRSSSSSLETAKTMIAFIILIRTKAAKPILMMRPLLSTRSMSNCQNISVFFRKPSWW